MPLLRAVFRKCAECVICVAWLAGSTESIARPSVLSRLTWRPKISEVVGSEERTELFARTRSFHLKL